MAVRTAAEILNQMKVYFSENPPEGYESLMEDITDSVGDINLNDYIKKDEYDRVVSENEVITGKYNDIRSRYINRFYDGYKGDVNVGYINSSAPQSMLEKEEKITSYNDLFE